MRPQRIVERQAREFLLGRYGQVDDLRPLGGGFWSSAFAFSLEGRSLVVRFGASADWFEADRAAMAFASPDLPVPEVLEIGEALGGAYAVSSFRHGTPLENVRPDQRDAAGPMLASLLAALYRVPKGQAPQVGWHWRAARPDLTWRGWLLECLGDDPTQVDEQQAALAVHAEATAVHRQCTTRVRELLGACPERRDLVHGDLLHANVLVANDASRPTAVFSWKCSVRGDFLYDVAWCTFWSAWHPGIEAADPWRRIHAEPVLREDAEAWMDASVRHHCYELHIGAAHLGWNAWLGDLAELERVAGRLTHILSRGPLPPVAPPETPGPRRAR